MPQKLQISPLEDEQETAEIVATVGDGYDASKTSRRSQGELVESATVIPLPLPRAMGGSIEKE